MDSRNNNLLPASLIVGLAMSALLTVDAAPASMKRTMSEINQCMSEAVRKNFPEGGAEKYFFGFTMVDQSGKEIRIGSFGRQVTYEIMGIGETDWKIQCRPSKKSAKLDNQICMVWIDNINCLISKYK